VTSIEQAREQARVLEDAIALARAKHEDAEPRALAAYLESLVDELLAVRARIDAELGLSADPAPAASLWLRLRGGRVGDGRAPVHVVGKMLEALQRGTRQVAAFIELGTAVVHRIPKEIDLEASLDMLAFAKGSARIAVAPAVPQLRVHEPEPLADKALQQLVAAAVWAEGEGSDKTLDDLFPDVMVRRQVLSRIRDMAPGPRSDYAEVEFRGPVVAPVAQREAVIVTARGSSHASSFLRRHSQERVTYGGQLVAIDIEKEVFDLRHKHRRIRCHIPPTLHDAAKGAIESFVEVEGVGTFQRGEELPRRVAVSALRALTMEERARLR